jgi:tungstate transport system substrate-binding protein
MRMIRRICGGPIALGAVGLMIAAAGRVEAQAGRDVVLATTTSTQDTGLLDSLVPRFEKQCGCRLKVVAVGTGAALALGARGEADVVLVHAPGLEQKYVAEGKFVNRRLVMTNDFLVVGPPADPAGLRQSRTTAEAFQRLARGAVPFVSRADSSGTNLLEFKLWKAAGLQPSGPWYLQAGQGMGATLQIASEKKGYTLTDRGTYLALRSRLDLAPAFERAPELLNIYHVMETNPDSFPKVNKQGGRAFADFMLSPAVQGFIGSFGTAKFGQPLFTPQGGKREEDLQKRAA